MKSSAPPKLTRDKIFANVLIGVFLNSPLTRYPPLGRLISILPKILLLEWGKTLPSTRTVQFGKSKTGMTILASWLITASNSHRFDLLTKFLISPVPSVKNGAVGAGSLGSRAVLGM